MSSFFCTNNGAIELSCDGELSEAPRTSQAADLFNQPSELCDQIFKSLTNNVIKCEYLDIYDKTLSLQNDSNFIILMHLNIRVDVTERANELVKAILAR